MATLEQLNFDNSFARLGTDFYTRIQPSPLTQAYLVHANAQAAALLDLDASELTRTDFVAHMQGEKPLVGSDPLAMVYSGHQFGYYNPRLGDGRGLLLGEVVNSQGERWDLHLKGAGLTPYSRQGDGRAVLRSCIREYLASEALHHLGIPTSRALCIISSQTPVYREKVEPGAMLVRISPSHIRMGSFEYFSHTGQHDALRQLLDYSIRHYHPALQNANERYALFFQQIVHKTAQLVAKWQAFGFTHGVLNTDNMSILGITFDFGPYGFMDEYQANYIPNHSDHQGRYAFEQQPTIGLWNCLCLAQALEPVVEQSVLRTICDEYEAVLRDHYYQIMQNKLGFSTWQDSDKSLIAQLIGLLSVAKIDYTLFFRALSHDDLSALYLLCPSTQHTKLTEWYTHYQQRCAQDIRPAEQKRQQMLSANPKYVLRNHLAQQAIESAYQGDFSQIDQLYQVLCTPYAEQPDFESWAQAAPEWSKHLVISCSS